MIKKVLITLFLLFAFMMQAPNAFAYDGYSEFVLPNSGVSNVTNNDLYGLSGWELKVARNEIYARHGRAFKSSDLRCYFENQPWYVVDPQYSDGRLNAKELRNAQFILTFEKKAPGSVTYKDLGCTYGRNKAGISNSMSNNKPDPEIFVVPYSDQQYVTDGDLRYLSYWYLKVARNEIYARHGRAFKSADLRCYFEKQPWYSVNPNYSDNMLNNFEKKNAITILNLEKQIKSPVTYVDQKCGYDED